MPTQTQKEKEAFFKELEQLDETSDEEVNDRSISVAKMMQRKERPKEPAASHLPRVATALISHEETSSPPANPLRNSQPRRDMPNEEVTEIQSTSVSSTISRKQAKKPKPVISGASSPAKPGPKVITSIPAPWSKLGKRKRDHFIRLVSEHQRIFQGLKFFFYPNSDISQARRFRITKALERGAEWIKEWGPGITHVIVDRGLCYDEVVSFLKLQCWPMGVNLVDANYPADCIDGKCLFNPDQYQYRIKGVKGEVNKPFVFPSAPIAGSSTPATQEMTSVVPTRTLSEDNSGREITSDQEGVGKMSKPILRRALSGVGSIKKGNIDALDVAIGEAQETKNLPIDLEKGQTSYDDEGSDTEHGQSQPARKKLKVNQSSHDQAWQQNFSCMQKHDGIKKDHNPNARTIEILQEMADYYESTEDHWRLTAYRRAISALRKEKRKVITKEQALTIPFVGERLAAKIEEIVWTNRLRRLDNANMEPNERIIQTFLKIYGVGHVQALIWIDQGFRTLQDLVSKAALTKNQKIGIEHYEDFQTRIPRQEVEEHSKVVQQTIHACDKGIQVTIGGSYRRGALDSGDVDFIITKPNCSLETLRVIILDIVIPQLFENEYLKVGLATTVREDGTKWHGASCLPGSTTWRRIDFLLVPWEQMGAALIYFTGNDIFNRSIRLLASKKGMRLSQRGLYRDVLRGPGREKITEGTLVESKSEEKIFELLGVPWRPPEHRNC